MKRINRAITAALAAAVLTGCGTTPSGIVVTQAGKFGATMLSPTKKRPWRHQGVDFRKRKGAPVFAVADGSVTKATHRVHRDTSEFGCGQTVELQHSGLADGFATRYCHLGHVYVNYGDTVKRGQIIATVGKCRKGPPECSYHLHFEVTEGFTRHDPQTKIGGCSDDEAIELTRELPLIYPVEC